MNYPNTSLISPLSSRFPSSPSFLSSAEISVLHPSKDAVANSSASSSKDRGAHTSKAAAVQRPAHSSQDRAGSPSPEGDAAAPESTSSLEATLKDIDRLEEAYARLETQFLRAEENCQLVRKKNKDAEEPNLKEIMKADAFAHRVLLQQIRILRDLRLAHKNLERTAKELTTPAKQEPPQTPRQPTAENPTTPPTSNTPHHSNDAQTRAPISPTSTSSLNQAPPGASKPPSSLNLQSRQENPEPSPPTPHTEVPPNGASNTRAA